MTPPREITPEWCMAAFYRVNPGALETLPPMPSLYLLDFARAVAAYVEHGEPSPKWDSTLREIL